MPRRKACRSCQCVGPHVATDPPFADALLREASIRCHPALPKASSYRTGEERRFAKPISSGAAPLPCRELCNFSMTAVDMSCGDLLHIRAAAPVPSCERA